MSSALPPRVAWSTEPILELERVSASYYLDERQLAAPQLRDVNLTLHEGEILLVIGRTGAGKTTLLNAMSGAMPHATGGRLDGHVRIVGRDTRDFPPHLLSDVVGVVGQNPAAGFVSNTVEEELAYSMEQLGLAPEIMRKRVEETLDLLGIAELRQVPLTELSGGEQQRVAIGAVLTTRPALIILDEPTSALDPNGAEEVLATITKLAHDLAMTVVLAEHRIERVLQYVDRVAHVDASGTVTIDSPATIMQTSDVAPPLVELGRWAGWNPLPLSVRSARTYAPELRQQLFQQGVVTHKIPRALEPLLVATDVVVDFPAIRAVDNVSLQLNAGEISVLMGRNGCGKSSLLWALQGSGKRTHGRVYVDGTDPLTLKAANRRRLVSMVPQNPSDLLYEVSVVAELQRSDRDSGAPAGTTRAILDSLVPNITDHVHPRDLSEGQKLALALAIQLATQPPVVFFDEPTRGLDYAAKKALAAAFKQLAAQGRALLVVTHDVEFAALCADRVLFMANGSIIADGSAVEMLASSPAYAPQIAKVTSGLFEASHWLTVPDVQRALSEVLR
ncbi:ABC transporter ATP-binding protein [Corynebacterium callunae]|uniref:ABC transporter ATP-binding protein n=1 Tax=Corynebacterium callunae TaxID=1721 RepID=UPI003981E811